MSELMSRADDADRQRAFLGLLANPVVTPWTDPALYTLVHRHARQLGKWCKRLRYQLMHLDQCYRLRRPPIDGVVATPHRAAPRRSELLLTLYAAICLDDHHEDSITIQDLSDVVRLSTAGRGGWPYDPDLHSHRGLFVDALKRLQHHGVLELRTEQTQMTTWQRSGEGIGGGYIIHRDALVLFIDSGDVDLAFARRADTSDSRSERLLRILIEAQALYIDELDPADRDYLRQQRARLADRAAEMTGGQVEIRTESLVLSIPADRSLPDELVINFPAATALDWAALSLISRIAVQDRSHAASATDVLRYATQLHEEAGERLTAELRESPGVIAAAVGSRLSELGLLRIDPDDGTWRLTPLAARYRDAELKVTDDAPAAAQELFLLEDT